MKNKYILFALIISLIGFTVFSSIEEVQQLIANGEYKTALDRLSEFPEERLQNPKILLNKGFAHYKIEEKVKALENFIKASKKLKEESFNQEIEGKYLSSQALYNQATLIAENKNWNKAINKYQEALRLTPNDPELKFNYLYAYKQLLNQKNHRKPSGSKEGNEDPPPDSGNQSPQLNQGDSPSEKENQNENQIGGNQDKIDPNLGKQKEMKTNLQKLSPNERKYLDTLEQENKKKQEELRDSKIQKYKWKNLPYPNH